MVLFLHQRIPAIYLYSPEPELHEIMEGQDQKLFGLNRGANACILSRLGVLLRHSKEMEPQVSISEIPRKSSIFVEVLSKIGCF